MQTISYTLAAIERRVILDPNNDITKVTLNQLAPSAGVGRTSLNLLATDPNARFNNLSSATANISLAREPGSGGFGFGGRVQLGINMRDAALKQADLELTQAGLLGPDGKVSKEAQTQYGFERTTSLPTPGILVKGCLDNCAICEPDLHHEIQLDLKRKELENKLLERKIELLDKSQEYRCCPEKGVAQTCP